MRRPATAVAALAATVAVTAVALPPGGAGAQDPAPADPDAQILDTTATGLLTPVPIVRIVGSLTSSGAKIGRLTVRTPPLVRIVLRCTGKPCAFSRQTRTVPDSTDRLVSVRLTKAERSYAAGATISVSVVRRGVAGKYVGFQVRRGKAPRRSDACASYASGDRRSCP